MFIDNYEKICKLKGISPTSVLKILGVSKGTYTNWKATGAEPLNPTKKKIADYFDISINELESGEIKNPATITDDRTKDLDEDLVRRLCNLSPDKVEIVRAFVQGLESGHKG